MAHYLVTGAAGFIGSHLVDLLLLAGHTVMGLDKFTYAGRPENLESARKKERFVLAVNDVCDGGALDAIFSTWSFDGVFHLAAETHVDRSIADASDFARTNVLGTLSVLEASRKYWEGLAGKAQDRHDRFKLVVVSTDEVWGSLELGSAAKFDEDSPVRPRSPYAATKAAADMLALSYFHTHGLPVIVTRCGNNYGSRQFPEKLIPLAIERGIRREIIPLYGDGENIRDWIFVRDHCRALVAVMGAGRPGQTYAIGARCEKSNRQVLEAICGALDEVCPWWIPHGDLIEHVEDRKGHDRRYGIDPSRAERELDWSAQMKFEDGLFDTVQWHRSRHRSGTGT
jgi:dTDP-glucose 4,6-dehydratase